MSTSNEVMLLRFKLRVATVIDELNKTIIDAGGSYDDVDGLNRRLMEESMMLAACIHVDQAGSEQRFLAMAERAFALALEGT